MTRCEQPRLLRGSCASLLRDLGARPYLVDKVEASVSRVIGSAGHGRNSANYFAGPRGPPIDRNVARSALRRANRKRRAESSTTAEFAGIGRT